MDLSPAELAVFGTLGGALVGALSATAIAFINKKSEEKKHFRELVVKTAAEHWRHVSQISASNRMPPLTDYIVHTAKMCDLILNKNLDKSNIQSRLEELDEVMIALEKHANKVTNRKD